MRLDTEARKGYRDGLVAELNEKTRHAAYSILSEATSRGYEQIPKSFAQVSDVKLPLMFHIKKDRPSV
eukprot:4038735-Ditylum_brightwellii.AAC.1